ncbi:galactose mutarotase-like domain-containing protein [Neocallimastix lanati (nom. inval.)]|nr:galactose mutarotase-like domain-containing protein [Neocallimastix sp. JGI-2020a]
MLKHRSITIGRFNGFLSGGSFSDVNINSVLYSKKDSSAVRLTAYTVPEGKRILFKEAISKLSEFKPVKVGDSFGPSWVTVWFNVKIKIPDNWNDDIIYFLWNCNNEGLIWSLDGRPIQGLTGGGGDVKRHEYILTKEDLKKKNVEFYIESACNGMFGNGDDDLINPPDPDRYFTLSKAEIATPNIEVWNLMYDFHIIAGMAKYLPENSSRGSQALYTADKIINVFDPKNKESWSEARKVAAEFLNKHSGDAAHNVYAIGNCHIDTAWLWPYDETKRKCARSWASQIRLMEKYPDYVFVASQAQQFEWVRKFYPTLFKEMQEKYENKQFIPIGNTWVEMDCNIPSGESFIRQFLYGTKFFKDHFNYSSDIFWLPDTFGYSAQLPQIIKIMGMKYFFTQKLSWNNINKFPHTSFYWIGLDGSEALTHFSPANTYTANATVNDVITCEKNNKDTAYSNDSLLVYGVGDGGGGPLMKMIERLERMKDVDGLPKVILSDPSIFYKHLEENSNDLPKWNGELYFELHRGTYTSQAKNKFYNRFTEYLLHNIEFFNSLEAILNNSSNYPKEDIEELWKDILLNQFHDVLPGSSIGMVYDDSTKIYENVVKKGNKLQDIAIDSIISNISKEAKGKKGYGIFNTTQWTRSEIIEVPLLPNQKNIQQLSHNENKALIYVENVPGFGFKEVNGNKLVNQELSITYQESNQSYIMRNSYVTVTFDNIGRIISFIDNEINRELICENTKGNQFKIYEDTPLYWDAWYIEIYHLEKNSDIINGNVKIIENGPLRIALEVNIKISDISNIKQYIYLTPISKMVEFDTEVEWHESHKFLKVEFSVDILCDTATYETAFGFVKRPTHYNTSWDMAKFEVCGHKFADLSEYGYGVSLLNNCKYGYAIHEKTMRLSLLRSPKAPDDNCDMGIQKFRYALLPHIGSFNESSVVEEGYRFNVPLIPRYIEDLEISNPYQLLINDKPKNVIIDTIKFAENENAKDKAVIVRIYEAYGGTTSFKLSSEIPVKKCYICNGLEENIKEIEWKEKSCLLVIKPFKIMTLKLFL